MSEKKNEEPEQKTTEDGRPIIGEPEDVERFAVGDLVQVHLEMNGQVFLTPPHGEQGVVVSLSHDDDRHFFHMPVVQFASGMKMFNPDHIIVVQRDDGSKPEEDRLKAAEKATAKAKREAEKKEQKEQEEQEESA